MIKDLAVMGLELRLNEENNIVIVGLNLAETKGIISQDMKTLIKESVKAIKPQLIDYFNANS